MKAENLVFAYPGQPAVLRDLSFELEQSSLTLLSGRNGSGKSTLLRLLCGLLKPTDGRIVIEGKPIHTLDARVRARQVAVAFQFPGDQLTERTVLREMELGMRAVGGTNMKEASLAALRSVGLSDLKDMHPYDLEPAQRKLLTVGCALASPASWILLDEPFAGLSMSEIPLAVDSILKARNSGRTVLLVAHDPSIIIQHADRVIAIDKGSMVDIRPREGGITVGDVALDSKMPTPSALRFMRLWDSQRKTER